MIGTATGLDWGLIAAVYMALTLFGLGFNALISWTERKGYLKGYVSLAVALGVGVIVAATAIFNPLFSLLTFGAFLSGGWPMIIGSIYRHVKEREQMMAELRKEARDEANTIDAR